ncbi:uncharacterized protein FIBRA_00960 [Fibroporia radiculosa]|uniref:Uncharacterized protein n=1 Tax=Fibroporia radiculosa TaxID=599839 RepID=J4HSJ1_9APHY|nr:uncharacterized protein FIBRA_00960 [Fibroporia radiculosa]CCL98952.1 predicted protein [Fibroporia radiculosa]
MLRGAGRLAQVSRCSCKQAARKFHSERYSKSANSALLYAAATVTVGAIWYSTHSVIHNDASPADDVVQKKLSGIIHRSDSKVSSSDKLGLDTLVWGSNKAHILALDNETLDSIRTPATAAWLDNVALRDLALHERHAACVDARGDVYQWGDGFSSCVESSSGKPMRTLRGMNIVRIQVTPSRVFALSASGRIYVLSSSAQQQTLPPGTPTPTSSPWWGTGWLWGDEEGVDFAEVTPHEKLHWGEKFVSIAGGSDHLLALTSSGRTFAHPITLNANSYGQLGLRKIDVPAPASASHPHLPHGHRRVQLELTPKSIADPYAKSSPATRPVSPPVEKSADASDFGLDDRGLNFSDKLFEIPALRGVQVDSIAAGSRSSFAKTAGRVLGWGANEFGCVSSSPLVACPVFIMKMHRQIGLGSQVTLDTITVPTEVILWRSTPSAMRTTCLDVYAGGDLTFFKVERSDGTAMPYIDVLACGNGQWGGLGNAQFSNAQSTPVRARSVSGLLEYSEKHNNLQAIMPSDISVSPTGHVLLTLDTLVHGGPGAAGRDVMAWGANYEYQLGNGKRGSVSSPAVIQDGDGERLMLQKRRATEVRDLQGKIWKKGVEVEQRAVAGWGNSFVYWKICS